MPASARLAQLARDAGVLVNVEDVPDLCDFHVPAAVRRGDLLLTVSTGGRAPGLSRILREWLETPFRRRMDRPPRRYRQRARVMARRRPFAAAGFAEHARSCRRRRAGSHERHRHRHRPLQGHHARMRSIAPAAGATDPAIDAQACGLAESAEGRDAKGILELALKGEFAGKTAVVSSFGSESVVLLHMIAQIDPTTPVIFLNTGKLFGETLRYRDRLQDQLGLTDVRSIGPHPARPRRARSRRHAVVAQHRCLLQFPQSGAAASARWKASPPRSPAASGSRPMRGWRWSPSNISRAGSASIRWPIGRWPISKPTWPNTTCPRHPLVEDGYPSIGCMPCTRRVLSGESYRDGRWAGTDKDECGIHTGVDGEGI